MNKKKKEEKINIMKRRRRKIPIRDSHCRPNSSKLVSLSDHFEDPHFVLVHDGERLAFAVIAVSGDQIGHHFDGFTGSLGALQRQPDQVSVVDDALLRDELFTTDESGLADGDLILVHVADDVVCVGHLRDLAERPVGRISVRSTHVQSGRILI